MNADFLQGVTIDEKFLKSERNDIFKQEIRDYFRGLKDAQFALEQKKTNPREVDLRDLSKTIVLRVGTDKSNVNSCKIYSPMTRNSVKYGSPLVRFESCIRNSKSFLKEVEKVGLKRARWNWLKQDLSSIVETPLLAKHRTFLTIDETPPYGGRATGVDSP